jgi:predicted dehydrogenase
LIESSVLISDMNIETPWRKTPAYQGGFLLDGGVHFIAGTRLLLGETNRPTRISAFSNQLQEHLPPVDTVDATWRTESGISGTFSLSFGTSFKGSEYIVACEKGTVSVSRGVVIVTVNGKEEEKKFADEGSGVKQEVAAWAKGLENRSMDPQQSPQEALQDLRVVSQYYFKYTSSC